VPALAPSKGEMIISAMPTHVVTELVEVRKSAGNAETVVQMLNAFTTVTLLKTEAGWALVAKDGRMLGFVAAEKLHALR
jgi:hypothetical protein